MKRVPNPAAWISAIWLPAIALSGGILVVQAAEQQDPASQFGHPILHLKPRLAPALPRPRPRLVSPEASARIKSVLAEVAPVEPIPAEGQNAPAAAPHREQDPNDPVVVMERFYVSEDKVPRLSKDDVLTWEGKAALVRKRHPGGVSRAFIEQELALERRRKMMGLLSLLPTNPSELKAIRAVKKRGISDRDSWIEKGGPYQAGKKQP